MAEEFPAAVGAEGVLEAEGVVSGEAAVEEVEEEAQEEDSRKIRGG